MLDSTGGSGTSDQAPNSCLPQMRTTIPNSTANTQTAKQTTAPAVQAVDGLLASPSGPSATTTRPVFRDLTPSANRAGRPAPSTMPTTSTCSNACNSCTTMFIGPSNSFG